MAKKRITRVTTRRGDAGETSLADGSSVSKSSDRIHTVGAVDELNSFVGWLRAKLDSAESEAFDATLGRLQQELFDLGAYLATVGMVPAPEPDWLEEEVGRLNEALPPLTEFVIPGGSEACALTHVCRTVCRRAERHAWATEDVDDAARYLNRLSDLFFVMARTIGQDQESQWRGIEKPTD
ncbi:MAG: cob(I)yrinic acid a,c-diamide adenosyltransferase [Gammaproteobacteria bacterium]|nr:MAG: cob(I)yrinic acid a,c-diamide adenosyltransferase [Gammaproteobacteria bacterium]